MRTLGNMLQNMESIKDEIQGAAEAGGKQAMVVCKGLQQDAERWKFIFQEVFLMFFASVSIATD